MPACSKCAKTVPRTISVWDITNHRVFPYCPECYYLGVSRNIVQVDE